MAACQFAGRIFSIHLQRDGRAGHDGFLSLALSGFYPDVLILNPVRPGKATMNAEIFCVNSKIQEYGYK